MTVTKRLRFEILRRDDNTCRYCGSRAPDVKLTVDHVIAKALGGSDDPANLVAACADCNSGKSATAADQNVVDDVSSDALRWARAMEMAATARASKQSLLDDFTSEFRGIWAQWDWTDSDGKSHYVELPLDWRRSIERFYGLNLDMEFMRMAIDTAMRNTRLSGRYAEFRYVCGICYRTLEDQVEAARRIVESGEA